MARLERSLPFSPFLSRRIQPLIVLLSLAIASLCHAATHEEAEAAVRPAASHITVKVSEFFTLFETRLILHYYNTMWRILRMRCRDSLRF